MNPPKSAGTVHNVLRFHSMEVMVYQYDKLVGYGWWMTSILTITHILIFLGYSEFPSWLPWQPIQILQYPKSIQQNITMWVMVGILVIQQPYPKNLSYWYTITSTLCLVKSDSGWFLFSEWLATGGLLCSLHPLRRPKVTASPPLHGVAIGWDGAQAWTKGRRTPRPAFFLPCKKIINGGVGHESTVVGGEQRGEFQVGWRRAWSFGDGTSFLIGIPFTCFTGALTLSPLKNWLKYHLI